MLPRAQRLTSTLDYSRVVRRGTRFSASRVVLHVAARESSVASAPGRFGFVVSKAVGSAPRRNRVKRQLRSLCAPLASELNCDIVVRALPAAASASWADLQSDLNTCVAKWTQAHG